MNYLLGTVSSYIRDRFSEWSTLDGAVFLACGVGYLMFMGIAEYIAYAAIAYGLYKIVKVD